jgi:hypothetical protein
MRKRTFLAALAGVIALVGTGTAWAQKYTGPHPAKPDVLYLVHADTLIATELAEAKEDKKNDTTYSIAGVASPARTPLAEPIFIIESDKILPQSLELYKLDVKNGHREVTTVAKRTRGGPKPLRLSVTRLDKGLYRIEADQEIENGQYAITPNGSNTVFCFEVY